MYSYKAMPICLRIQYSVVFLGGREARARGEPLQLPEEDGPDHDGAGGATVCAHHQGDPASGTGTVWKYRSSLLRSESARGVRIILIDSQQLFRIRIPKYALSFEAKYKKKSPNPFNNGIFIFSLFVYFRTSVAKSAN
jgi:hypothetical protein